MIKQYDVFKYKSGYIANIQAITDTKTYICCLISKDNVIQDPTNLTIKINNNDYTLLTNQIFTLESHKLNNKVDNIKQYRQQITNILDKLFYQQSYPL